MKNKINKASLLMFIIFPIALVIDIVAKYIVESKISLGDSSKFLPGFIELTLVHNEGAAWSLFSGMQVLLIIITILFLLVLLWFFFTKRSNSAVLGIAVGFIVGGSMGNLYDRLMFGYVRDFFNFQFIKFPIFNVADICLTVGIILFVIYMIFVFPKEYKDNKEGK